VGSALLASPEGRPLLFIAPKQATFQIERQLLADARLQGFTRLYILSFERLAHFVIDALEVAPPRLLSEEGRVMVLRALLARGGGGATGHRSARRKVTSGDAGLQVFRASARLPGFAQELSGLIRECQRAGVTPGQLRAALLKPKTANQNPKSEIRNPKSERRAANVDVERGERAEHEPGDTALEKKLSDIAWLFEQYEAWLSEQKLADADRLLEIATRALKERAEGSPPEPLFEGLWLDGFAEMTVQEMEVLAAVLPWCEKATLAFCCEREALTATRGFSPWTVVAQTARRCVAAIGQIPKTGDSLQTPKTKNQKPNNLQNPNSKSQKPNESQALTAAAEPWPGAGAVTERRAVCLDITELSRDSGRTRFAGNAEFAHLERHWAAPCPFPDKPKHVRLLRCASPETEVIFAAREICRHVREGGRYRDAAVLVREIGEHQDVIRRVFTRYGIPCFLDRREPVAHHPLAELTRYALRTIARGWKQEDWFGVLKCGLVGAPDVEIDWLENEALARGWTGKAWLTPIAIPENKMLEERLEVLRRKAVGPLRAFQKTLEGRGFTTEAAQRHRAGRDPKKETGELTAEALTAQRQEETTLPVGDGSLNAKTIGVATADLSPSGEDLAHALQDLWRAFDVEKQLADWTSEAADKAVHTTVWEQMQQWLETMRLGFGHERVRLREWLPIIEAGLAGLTVGVIPPLLDEVLVGSIDRSRNPDLKIAFVLGVNEGVFPAVPPAPALLTEADRDQLEGRLWLGPVRRQHLAHERFYGYIALTRAREKLFVTNAEADRRGRKLNPSAFITHLQRLFPELPEGTFNEAEVANDVVHASELAVDVAKALWRGTENPESELGLKRVLQSEVFRRVRDLPRPNGEVERELSAPLVARLYPARFVTSVSRLEEFAACAFRFFVTVGLRARERVRYEVDARHTGTFQHEVLMDFHHELQKRGVRWRDVIPSDARALVGTLARTKLPIFKGGVLLGTERDRVESGNLIVALEDFIETVVGWAAQYDFDPFAVELKFGDDEKAVLPAWEIDVGGGRKLAFTGTIDRVDALVDAERRQAHVVVMDYKSSAREIDHALLGAGVQMQLFAYLTALHRLAPARTLLGVDALSPAGVFYVSLRGYYDGADVRDEALASAAEARRGAYQHRGRFVHDLIERFDNGASLRRAGDQFSFRLKKDGAPDSRTKVPVDGSEFRLMLDAVERRLAEIGRRIFAGDISVNPYRHMGKTACDKCDYQGICSIDPETHEFRGIG